MRASTIGNGLFVVLGLLFVLAVPTFLSTWSLRVAINSSRLYEYGFDRYNAVERTGLPKAELLRAGKEIIAYFNNSEQELRIIVPIDGRQQELLNEREVAHMEDVKGLVRGVYLWQWISVGYLLGLALVGSVLWRGSFWPSLARWLLWGSVLSIGGLLLLGFGALIGFDALFTQFHLLSFSNDLWLLDPRTDKLIQMFPESFFRDATLFVALEVLFGALGIGGAAGSLLRWKNKPLRLHLPLADEAQARG